jgi:hypothetical protein
MPMEGGILEFNLRQWDSLYPRRRCAVPFQPSSVGIHPRRCGPRGVIPLPGHRVQHVPLHQRWGSGYSFSFESALSPPGRGGSFHSPGKRQTHSSPGGGKAGIILLRQGGQPIANRSSIAQGANFSESGASGSKREKGPSGPGTGTPAPRPFFSPWRPCSDHPVSMENIPPSSKENRAGK